MLEQFLKSILAYFVSIEPMNAYIQKMNNGVEYPCYILNKCDIKTHLINSFFFLNTATVHFRIFGTDEVDLKNKVFNLTEQIYDGGRKIPILNEDGTESKRYIRLDNIETIELVVDENNIYCLELLFDFDTTHNITEQEFNILSSVNKTITGGE